VPAGRAKAPSSADDPSTTSPDLSLARGSLTRQDWVDAAIEMLVDQGIDAVRIDVLAKRIGMTRGSFYWHFESREDLLRAVLQAWRESTTENLTSRLERASNDPREQLRDLLSLPFRGRSAARGARIELAIRAWARRDAMARQFVDESDASRIAYASQIFSSLGFAAGEARHRAVMAYGLDVACSQLTAAGGVWRADELQAFAATLLAEAPPVMPPVVPGSATRVAAGTATRAAGAGGHVAPVPRAPVSVTAPASGARGARARHGQGAATKAAKRVRST
jgi:AcrR family transcriptional regulator